MSNTMPGNGQVFTVAEKCTKKMLYTQKKSYIRKKNLIYAKKMLRRAGCWAVFSVPENNHKFPK